jgi:hypothetical protein
MTRTRLSLISSTAVASILGAALPAFAQAPAPAPMYAPAPAPAPMYAPPLVQEPMLVIPVAPVMAPRAADDMTGSVGFGTGVLAGTSLVVPDTGVLMLKYWMSDAMAIIPRLDLAIHKQQNVTAGWRFAPSVLADFTLLKGASTRLSAGLGLGLLFAKNQAAPLFAGGDQTATQIEIFVPAQIGVEHFFARWFSMGIAANFKFIDFQKQGTPWTFDVAVNNVNFLGSMFIYTD